MRFYSVSDSSSSSDPSPSDEVFGIGEVSRLTGISDHALRVWERRYRVVDPGRTETRRREYTREDIRRLSLIKMLVDAGHAIRHLAPLGTEALEARLRETQPAGNGNGPAEVSWTAGPTRVAFAGSLSRDVLRAAADAGPGLQIVGEFITAEELGSTLRPGAIDLVVVECPTVFEEEVAAIQQLVESLHARRAVMIYRFAKTQALQPADKDIRCITALRAPVTADELRLACLADAQPARALARRSQTGTGETAFPAPAGVIDLPPRLFNDRQLARIARHSSVVQCECPQHLANLLASLAAFESYSAECENRNEEDAQLHAYLHRVTADCRAEMEAALSHLMEVEGISVDD